MYTVYYNAKEWTFKGHIRNATFLKVHRWYFHLQRCTARNDRWGDRVWGGSIVIERF